VTQQAQHTQAQSQARSGVRCFPPIALRLPSFVGARIVQVVVWSVKGPATPAAVTAARRVDIEGTILATCSSSGNVDEWQAHISMTGTSTAR
jgi:hypothetical protein